MPSPAAARGPHAPPTGTSLFSRRLSETPEPPNTTSCTLEVMLWPSPASPGSDLPSGCWPHAARPKLEAAELEEAGDHRGEVRVLRNRTEVSRSNSKENTKEAWSDTLPETHQEAASQHQNSREVFCQGTTTTTRKPRGQ
jgi:hypothetical protein